VSPINPQDLAAYTQELLRKLWTTKGVRFESSRRLEKMHALSGVTTAILSVYVIAVTVLQLVTRQETTAMRYLFPLVTIVAPVFILVLEAYEGGKQYRVRADRMHMSAHRVQALHADLQLAAASGAVPLPELSRVNHEYQEILRDFTAQHDNVDYFYFRSLNLKDFSPASPYEAFRWKMKGRLFHYTKIGMLPFTLIVAPGSLLAVAIISLAHTR